MNHLQPIDPTEPLGIGATHVGVGVTPADVATVGAVYAPMAVGAVGLGLLGAILFKKHRVLGGVGGAILGIGAGAVYIKQTT